MSKPSKINQTEFGADSFAPYITIITTSLLEPKVPDQIFAEITKPLLIQGSIVRQHVMAVRLRAPSWGIAESIFLTSAIILQNEYKTAKHQSYSVDNVVPMRSNTQWKNWISSPV